MDRSDELKFLIEIVIKINNRIYKKRLKKEKNEDTFIYYRYQTNTQKKKTRIPEYYFSKRNMFINLNVTK